MQKRKKATPTPAAAYTSASAPVPRRAFLKRIGVGAVGGTMLSLVPPIAEAQEKPVTGGPGLFDTIYSMRAIRRLKPDPIPEKALRKIIEAGIHAPNGGNRQDWGFILVRDPEKKQFIRDHYWETFRKLRANGPPLKDLPTDRQRTMQAAAYLAEHLQEVPVLLLACSAKEYPPWAQNPRASAATMHASIYPAVQNILLACRALGIGATLTTTHYFFEDVLKEKFGVPENMEIAALLPLGFPRGRLGQTTRKPVEEVMFWDQWSSRDVQQGEQS